MSSLSKKPKKSKISAYSNIVILGMMACGKSSLARELAISCKLKFVDLDHEIIDQTTYNTIPEIFEKLGEKQFRKIESNVLKKVIERNDQVIALGGGTFIFESNQELINIQNNNLTVFLDTDFDVIYDRLVDLSDRPIFNQAKNKENFYQVYKQRLPEYNKADIIIKNKNKNLAQLAQIVKKKVIKYES